MPQESASRTLIEPSEEIVVRGRRGDAADPSEMEFHQGDIAISGSDTIQELLYNIQPFIDQSDVPPVILINGKPSGYDTSILSYPVEALARVAVLKPEAGRRYGAKTGARVVNLVLKPKFTSLAVEADGNAATAGGQYGGHVGAMRTAISGDTRWNTSAQLTRQSALLKSARRISDGGAAFEAIASAVRRDDATGPGDAMNPDDFETLQPATGNATFGINIARPIGKLAASFNLDASHSRSDSLRGLLEIPQTWTGWSLDAGGVSSRPWYAGSRALHSRSSARSLGASLTLTGPVRGVQASLAASLSYGESDDLLESNVDLAGLSGNGETDNAGSAPRMLHSVPVPMVRRSHSRAGNLNFRLNLQKAALDLPAGRASWAFFATAGRGRSVMTHSAIIDRTSVRSSYAQSATALSLSLPISSVGSAFSAFGDLAIDLSLNRQVAAGNSAETGYGGAVSWAPIAQVQLRGSLDRSQNIPSPDQLNGPLVTSISRFFDYARREFAQPTWTTGGNPSLRRGNHAAISLSMMMKPLDRQELTLNLAYNQSVGTDSPASFPELTPAIEAAFPERVVRDPAGRLLAIDARPINIERQKDATLSAGLTFRPRGVRRLPSNGSPLQFAGDPVQVNLVLNYRLRVRSEVMIRRDFPLIDRLEGSGASRHEFNSNVSVGTRAFGGSLAMHWSSDARVSGTGGAFKLRQPIIVGAAAFVNIEHLLKITPNNAWAQGMKMSIDIQNVFRGYGRVTLPDGSVPRGYSRDDVDPLGRSVRFTIRKQL